MPEVGTILIVSLPYSLLSKFPETLRMNSWCLGEVREPGEQSKADEEDAKAKAYLAPRLHS